MDTYYREVRQKYSVVLKTLFASSGTGQALTMQVLDFLRVTGRSYTLVFDALLVKLMIQCSDGLNSLLWLFDKDKHQWKTEKADNRPVFTPKIQYLSLSKGRYMPSLFLLAIQYGALFNLESTSSSCLPLLAQGK